MRRSSQRFDHPARAALHFVNDILVATTTPLQAARLLDFPQQPTRSDSALLSSIFLTLFSDRYAGAQPEVYCDALHTLGLIVEHSYFEEEFERLVREGGRFCQELFGAVVAANSAAGNLKNAMKGVKWVTYRADVYSVLASGLRFVHGERIDAHQSVLIDIFHSFFPGDANSAIRDDFVSVQMSLDGEEVDERLMAEVKRLFSAIASFVERSLVCHWRLFKNYSHRALGALSTIAASSLQMVNATFLLQAYERLNEPLCYLTSMIYDKLQDEIATSAALIEEMLRSMDVFQDAFFLVQRADKRMTEKLRVHVFGTYRAVLLLILGLPSNSGFRADVSFFAGTKVDEVMAVLSENLDFTSEAKEIHVVLFDLVSLVYEYPAVGEAKPRSEAFIEVTMASLPLLTSRLARFPSPLPQEISLVNAQLVFLSKIAAPLQMIIPDQLLRGPPDLVTDYSLVTKAIEILLESRLFDILVKKWPLEDDQAVKRVRLLQPTAQLGLNLILNVLFHHKEDTIIQEAIARLFVQHLEEFQAALKMGSTRRIVDGDWKPEKSDTEIAQLIDKLIQNSTIKAMPEVFSQVAPHCPSIQPSFS